MAKKGDDIIELFPLGPDSPHDEIRAALSQCCEQLNDLIEDEPEDENTPAYAQWADHCQTLDERIEEMAQWLGLDVEDLLD